MKIVPRLLYLAALVGLAITAALALDRSLHPSMSTDLVRAVIMGVVLGASGLVHRKAWALSLILLPLGAYVLFRTVLPPGAGVEGLGSIYRFYQAAFATGGEQYAAKFFPLDLAGAPELRLVLVTVVYCVSGMASFFGLGLRRPVMGMSLALLLLGFSFTVDTIPRLAALAVIFLVLAACVLALARSLERRTWRLRDAVPGVLVGGAGAALAVLLLGAAPSAAATPWQDWRTWNPFNQGSAVYSFNWLQDYPKLLSPMNDAVIMRVEAIKPTYWRANALDQFTGNAWVASQDFLQDLQRGTPDGGTGQAGAFTWSVPAPTPRVSGTATTERFRLRSVYTNYFFTGGDPVSLTMDQDVTIRMNDTRALHVVNALGPSLDYTLRAVIPKITPAALVALGRNYPEGMERYLALPFPAAAQVRSEDGETGWRAAVQDLPGGAQWLDLYKVNQTMIGDATDPYQIALKLEGYLRRNFEYTLTPPTSDYSSPFAAFLFDTRAGYCQHFAGAMAMLLRFNGIPSRVAVGFTSGELISAGVFSVAANNAHAWVEAYFPTAGWVAFDPTPGRNLPYPGASSTSPGFRDPFLTSSSGSSTTTTEPLPDKGSTGTTADPATTGQSGRSFLARAPWFPWVLGIVVILAAWPTGRRLWRERALRRGTLTQRFAASLHLVRASLAAYGMAATRSSTFEDTLDFIEGHLGLTCDPFLEARAGAVLFGGRHARSDDIARAEAFRREVQAGLRRRHGWLRTVLVAYGVPPAKRRGAGKPALAKNTSP